MKMGIAGIWTGQRREDVAMKCAVAGWARTFDTLDNGSIYPWIRVSLTQVKPSYPDFSVGPQSVKQNYEGQD